MHIRVFLAGSLVLAAGMANAGEAGHSPRALIALEHRWVHASQAHDVRALETILAGNFVDSTFRGTLRTRAQVLSGPRAGSGYLSSGFKGLEVRLFGDTGIVTGIALYRKRGGLQTVKIRFTDVFYWQHGTWQAVSAQETLVPTH